MREAEGLVLKNDLEKRILYLEELTKMVSQRSPLVVEDYREKLKGRIKELLDETQYDEVRLNQEIVYFAEKSNITEELVRLQSHFRQFLNSLNTQGSVGRKLDF